jgi:hypothetical protein
MPGSGGSGLPDRLLPGSRQRTDAPHRCNPCSRAAGAGEFGPDRPGAAPALAPRSPDFDQGEESDHTEQERKGDSEHRSDPSSASPGAPGTVTLESAIQHRGSLLFRLVPYLFRTVKPIRVLIALDFRLTFD